MIKTGIFGGSFNPIHNGHIALAKKIREIANLDEVWFVVSPHNPLKDSAGLMPDDERLAMVEMALADEPHLVASNYEFRQPRPSYMLNTLRSLRNDYADREFTLIIGADNWLCFDKWYGYDEILSEFDVVIYPREGSMIDAATLPTRAKLVDTGLFNVSSTQVRQLIKEGKDIRELVPQRVADYLSGTTLISVIIPAYKKAEYIEDCLLSIVTQSFDSFEVVVVDDGSPDDTAAICDRLAAEHPQIKVIHTPNGGVTTARRIGYEHSCGRYITFADADDKMLPGSLQNLYDEMLKSEADEVVARYVNQHGDLRGKEGERYMQPSWMIKELLSSRIGFSILWAVLFRRSLLAGCLDTPRLIRSGEDIMMQIKCLLKSPKVWFSNEVVYLYNEGLPNDRPLALDEQKLYDDILYQIFSSKSEDEYKEYEPFVVLHQIKMYENFIYGKQFHTFNEYYSRLRKANISQLSLGDRIALFLPPRIAYYPVAWKKGKQDRKRQHNNR